MTNMDEPASNTGGDTSQPANRLAAELPARIRVHALAKLLGSSSKELLRKLAELGETARSAQSSVPREAALRVADAMTADSAASPAAPVAAAESAGTSEPPATGGSARPNQAQSDPVASSHPHVQNPLFVAKPNQPAKNTVSNAPSAGQPLADSSARMPLFATASPLFLPPEPVAKPARAATQRTEKSNASGAEKKNADTPADSDNSASGTNNGDNAEQNEDDRGESGRRRRRRGRRGRGRGKGGDDFQATDAAVETGGQDDQDDRRRADSKDARQANGDLAAKAEAAEGGDGAANPATNSATNPASNAQTSPADSNDMSDGSAEDVNRRRRRRRRRKGGDDTASADAPTNTDDPPNTVVHVREAKAEERPERDEVRSVRGSTRLEAKRQRRRDGREAGRRRAPILSEAEFLARREAVARTMVVAEKGDSTQVGVLEDGVLVEHFVTTANSGSLVGNVYLGRVQNVLPSMEAAFVDIGRGRNGVLYAGEVDWDAAGLEGKSRKIEQALSTGDTVLVQVAKDPVNQKGARLTTQISLPGRFLVYVPAGGATGISRKLPENERRRLKDILKRIVPEDAGVIIRTASEGVTEEELARDVRRLNAQWEVIREKAESLRTKSKKNGAPALLYEEPDLLIKVVRDLFTEDFAKLEVQGETAWETIQAYVQHVAPDLADRLKRYAGAGDVFTDYRIDEQILKALDRKVWLPSGGYLVIDRTEAMTVIDVNTGKFTGHGGNLEETVTRNNLESAEEIVRQLRLRDIGGIIVIDFIDMVLESNRDLVLRRLTECLGRDRTRHQVAEVTSLGLVQMTRKRIGTGLLEAFSTSCEHCKGRGVVVSADLKQAVGVRPVGNGSSSGASGSRDSAKSEGKGEGRSDRAHSHEQHEAAATEPAGPVHERREAVVSAVHAIANAAKIAAAKSHEDEAEPDVAAAPPSDATAGGPGARGASKGLNGHTPRIDPATEVSNSTGAVSEIPATSAETAEQLPLAEPVDGDTSGNVSGDAPEGESAAEAETTSVVEPTPPSVAQTAQAARIPSSQTPAPVVRSARRSRRTVSRPAGPPVSATDRG